VIDLFSGGNFLHKQSRDCGASARSRAIFTPVVELRQYTLHPGRRDALIDVFDNHLVESQEETGMKVIGQFRDLDRPDRFVWLRGFEDMESRRASLGAFYGGPVWAEYKDAANATMISSDDVLLLSPAWQGSAFDLAGAGRGRRDPADAIVVARIFHIEPAGEAFPERGSAVACRSRRAAASRLRHRARRKQLSASAGPGRRKCLRRVFPLRQRGGACAP
jgi:quinol monooxygenase YgiN